MRPLEENGPICQEVQPEILPPAAPLPKAAVPHFATASWNLRDIKDVSDPI